MTYSIIIPVYNDPALRQCLTALAHLHYDKSEYEVIVVENGLKTDWIEKLVQRSGYTYIYSERAGSYHARNLGIKQAKGSIFAFTDSDCAVDSTWLTAITATLTDPTIAGVMGYTRGTTSSNKIAHYEQKMYEANISNFTREARLKRLDTRNLAIRRSVYETIGGFRDDIRFGGDMEYGARAHAAGLALVYSEAMSATHANIEHLGTLLKKRVTQNCENIKLLNQHDREFIQTYFPHLLRYQPGILTRLRYWLYSALYSMTQPLSHFICLHLPKNLGYFYFKAANVLAIRLGLMKGVLHSTL